MTYFIGHRLIILVLINQIHDIMLSKKRVISTFAFFLNVPIYFLILDFYYFLAADFFESQMLVIVEVSENREDTLLLPL